MSSNDRFQIEPPYRTVDRYDHRNPEGRVRDGFMLTDTITGAERRFDRKMDAKAEIERTLAREAALDWTRIASFETPSIYAGSGLGEAYGYDKAGARINGMLCLVGGKRADTREQIRARVRAWLQAVGHPDLLERS